MPWRFLRTAARMTVKRNVHLQVEGIDHVPRTGPVLIAARHFHHLYDGCALIATLPRPAHILVGLDWVANRPGRAAMEALCRSARWPVVMRPGGAQGIGMAEAGLAFRRATRDSLQLFRDGRILLVFPEGYPNIDPGPTPKPDETSFLPFQQGYLRLVGLASRQGIPVPVVPAGFAYTKDDRWNVVLRFGAPLLPGSLPAEDFNRELEQRVRDLSGLDETVAS